MVGSVSLKRFIAVVCTTVEPVVFFLYFVSIHNCILLLGSIVEVHLFYYFLLTFLS